MNVSRLCIGVLLSLISLASVVAQDKTSPAMPVDWANANDAQSMTDSVRAMSPKRVNLQIKRKIDSLASIQPKKGDTGQSGTNGVDGITPIISVGSVTTTASGTQPTVTKSGSTTAPVFSFSFPSPLNGSNGSNGMNGVTPAFLIGSVTSGTAMAVNISGTSTSPILNFTLVPGQTGLSGPQALTTSTTQTVPTLAIATPYSFTTACAGAKVGMPVVVSWPSNFLVNISSQSANIETDGIITTRFTALILLSTAVRNFFYRVLQ